MQKLPHRYTVTATASNAATVLLASPGLPVLESAPPAEYDGPGDRWSPETLLVAAIADCFVLSFKAIARASSCEWVSISCDVMGTLDRVDRLTQFSAYKLEVLLEIPQGTDEAVALQLLEKAEGACLISNSLKAETQLEASVKHVARDET